MGVEILLSAVDSTDGGPLNSMEAGYVAAIVVGVVLGLVLTGVAIWLIVRAVNAKKYTGVEQKEGTEMRWNVNPLHCCLALCHLAIQLTCQLFICPGVRSRRHSQPASHPAAKGGNFCCNQKQKKEIKCEVLLMVTFKMFSNSSYSVTWPAISILFHVTSMYSSHVTWSALFCFLFCDFTLMPQLAYEM